MLFGRDVQEPLVLDGDNYACSLPTSEFFKCLAEKANADSLNPRYNWQSDGYMLLDQRSDDRTFIVSAHNMKPVFEVSESFRDGKSLLDGVNEWYYRPVLLPLDKDGQYTPVLRSQYRNGEIVRLGTFISGAHRYLPGKLPDRYDCDGNGYFSIWFDDSDGGEHDLRWMHWNGSLICCDNLLICPPEYLFQMGLVSKYSFSDL